MNTLLSPLDLFILAIILGGLIYVVLRLLITVIPLQYKFSQVNDRLGKLRHQLFISGVSIMLASLFIFMFIIGLILDVPYKRQILEVVLLLITAMFIVIAEMKHQIYHQQYIEDKKVHEE